MIQDEKKVGDDEKSNHHHGDHQIDSGSHAHHSGILRKVLERAGVSVANRFSSKPIDMEKNRIELNKQNALKQQQTELSILADDDKALNSIRDVGTLTIDEEDPMALYDEHLQRAENQQQQQQLKQHFPTLTPSEHAYLEKLLESENPEAIRRATLILSDHSLFPREVEQREDETKRDEDRNEVEEEPSQSRRDSKVQRLFFRMHEIGRGAGGRATATTTSSPRSPKTAFASSPIHGATTTTTTTSPPSPKTAFASSPIHGNSISATNRRRLTWGERKDSITLLESQTSMSSLLDVRNSIVVDSTEARNSLLMDSTDARNSILMDSSDIRGGGARARDFLRSSSINNSMMEQDDLTDFENDILAEDNDDEFPAVPVDRSGSSTTSQDISSWLDGTGGAISNNNNRSSSSKNNDEKQQQQGIEVDNDNGVMASAAESFFKTSFAILGTTADDAQCHPHVLSPPLMESLLEFVPETLSDYHWWIKYSMVRDGANLYTLLRHVRASSRTVLAIETTDGQVFGSFTSHPWRLVQSLIDQETKEGGGGEEHNHPPAINNENLFYGSNDSFLWKMRQSRFESQALVRSATVEQAILMESELAVYPFTGANNFVQHCSVEDGIGLGDSAAAIRLDPSLRTGSTAASETFGNPCLLDPKETDSVKFQVANIEVWALTPNDNVKDAEKLELTTFFQQRQQEERHKRLDLFGILVGGPRK